MSNIMTLAPSPTTRGYDRSCGTKDANHRLGAHLLHAVRQADSHIPAGHRAPRTVAEMRARINIAMNQACSRCSGAGGTVIDSSGGGVTRQSWQTCTACNGSGVAQ
ncbi:hypothetical protein ACFXPZ_14220 [Streptomyces sp. NPDC059101]|uniref:hypothetical protein n=1 Tax=unclassified Streptomyces TaxID=2593676 RepID=UPI000C275176|nr:hypothetical protein [Streptomyces sp. CB02959]PJN36618.1 hypothetical protein CG747_32285 [Streptomyces sp. CB02959]